MRVEVVTSPLRVCLVGWGAIGQTVGRYLSDSRANKMLLAPIEVVAIGVRDATIARPGVPQGAVVIDDPAGVAQLRPDVVAEAAGRDSVAPWARAGLDAGADVIVSSVSAFADEHLLTELTAQAARNDCSIHIQPGALGGIDALSSARLLGIDRVEHHIVKPPKAWLGTPAEQLCNLDGLAEPTAFFTGNATETADAFPKNANVAMTTALAGIGPLATRITLIADPAATANRHEISAAGAFGNLRVEVANNPLPGNPKTSAMAALNLVRAIENRVATVQL